MLSHGDVKMLIKQAQSWDGLDDGQLFERLLVRSNGNRAHVARTLGVSEATVRNRIEKYGLVKTT